MPRTAAIRKPKPAPSAAVTITLPELAKDETYAGVLLQDGKPSHHLVLLPGETTTTWPNAIAWAKTHGGELPTRKEQALLFANAANAFTQTWYWSSEEHVDPGTANYPWIQNFTNGRQDTTHQSTHSTARAVRRVPI